MREFMIAKTSGTHADVFAAAGLADVLAGVAECTINDRGTYFVIETDEELIAESLAGVSGKPGYGYLRTKAGAELPEGVSEEDVFDYPQQKARFDRFRQAQKSRRAGEGLVADMDADAPHEDFRLYSALNALQGDEGTNKAAAAVLRGGPQAWRKTLQEGVERLTRGEYVELDWKVNLVQLFNPQAAKGYSRLKPDSTDRNDQGKNRWAEPFLEWLKYRGYFRVACAYFIGSKGENVRLLCPIPERIEARLLNKVVSELRKAPIYGSAPKVDCLAVLTFAEILISRSKEYRGGWSMPSEMVSGLSIAHYQSMGQSKAVTGMEQLALPGWFEIDNEAGADLWRNTLDEHKKVIRSLKDDRSEEIGLILSYRRFLEKRGKRCLEALIAFLGDYGVFLMRERERDKGRRLKQFQTDHVRNILMAEARYQEILENPGFRAIAAAIRGATVSAQWRKLNNRDYRDIRYDLLPNLRRKRALPDATPLVEAIAEFVASYNAESARRYETGREKGMWCVTTEELRAFLGLLEKHKSSVVGAMLCAYATCREPREVEPETETEGEVENG